MDIMNTRVVESDGEWEVWLDGLCVSVGPTRDVAVAKAVESLEAAVEELQKWPGEAVPRG